MSADFRHGTLCVRLLPGERLRASGGEGLWHKGNLPLITRQGGSFSPGRSLASVPWRHPVKLQFTAPATVSHPLANRYIRYPWTFKRRVSFRTSPSRRKLLDHPNAKPVCPHPLAPSFSSISTVSFSIFTSIFPPPLAAGERGERDP